MTKKPETNEERFDAILDQLIKTNSIMSWTNRILGLMVFVLFWIMVRLLTT